MAKPTTVATEVARFRQSIEEMLRSRVRDAIESTSRTGAKLRR